METVNGRAPRDASSRGLDLPATFTGGIVTLDIARVTGWCALSRTAYRAWPLTPLTAHNTVPHPECVYGRYENGRPGDGYGDIFHAFDWWFCDLLDTYRPDWVVWEAPFLSKTRDTIDALRRTLGRVAMVEVACNRRQIRTREVPAQTAKKHVTGNGNAKKSVVRAAIESRGFTPQDDNVADAIAVADTFIAWRRAQGRG